MVLEREREVGDLAVVLWVSVLYVWRDGISNFGAWAIYKARCCLGSAAWMPIKQALGCKLSAHPRAFISEAFFFIYLCRHDVAIPRIIHAPFFFFIFHQGGAGSVFVTRVACQPYSSQGYHFDALALVVFLWPTVSNGSKVTHSHLTREIVYFPSHMASQ